MNRFIVAIVVSWICWNARACAAEPLFVPAPGSPIAVGQGSGQVVLADVDGDGHLDMVTQHLLTRSVAVLRGDGKGGFEPTAASPLRFEFQPGTIAMGDVNNDRILDLGIASRNDKEEHMHVLLGNGKGAFTPAAGSPLRTSASMKTYKPTLHFIDLNEDGDLDIVTSNGRRNTIEILWGDGRGGFSAGPTVQLAPGHDLYSFAVGDLDGDGHLDLATASRATSVETGRLAILGGDGKGGFKAIGSPVSVRPGPRIETLADTNGDQRLDLVLSHEANLLSVLGGAVMG